MFLVNTDFTGYHKISTNNFTQAELTSYITKYESVYLKELMGVALYNLFVASISSGLPTGVYLTIYNAFSEDSESCSNKILISDGMKEMLKGFVFFEYTRNQPIENTTVGNVKNVNENSEVVNGWKAGITEKYNRAIDTYKAIQSYIEENLTDYPTYNGVEKEKIFF